MLRVFFVNVLPALIGGAIVVIDGLATAFVTAKDIVVGAVDVIRNVVSSISGAFGGVLGFVRDNWPAIVTLISGPFAPLVALATNAFGVRSALTGAFDGVKSFLAGAWPAVSGIITAPFTGNVGAASNAFGLRGALEGAFHGIREAISGSVNATRDVIVGVWGAIRGAVATAISGILGAIDKFLGGLQGVFEAASHIPFVGDKFKGVAGAIEDAREKVQGLRSDMDKLSGKKVKTAVDVNVQFMTRGGADLGHPPGGGGEGAVGANQLEPPIREGARQFAEAMDPEKLWNLVYPGGGPLAANPGGLNPRILDELKIAEDMGLHLISGYRPGAITSSGNVSLHASGRAIDVGPPGATAAEFARRVAGRRDIAEVIYSPIGWWHPSAGWGPITDAQIKADHWSHVHVGTYAKGGIFTRPTLGIIGEAGPEAVIPLDRRRPSQTVAAGGGGLHVEVNVYGHVWDREQLVEDIYAGLLRKQGREVSLGFN